MGSNGNGSSENGHKTYMAAIGLWRLMLGVTIATLVGTALTGTKFAFDFAQKLIELQGSVTYLQQSLLEAGNRRDGQIQRQDQRLDRAFDQIRSLEREMLHEAKESRERREEIERHERELEEQQRLPKR